MDERITFLGWALAGLLGGVHCLGMCGGLASALGINAGGGRPALALLAANAGRLISYGCIGAILGGIGSAARWLPLAAQLQVVLYLVSLALVILLGLYLAGIAHGLTRLERLGGPIWRRVQPFFLRLVPIRSLPGALLAGALWGWLPCGLVYSAGMAALAGGSAVRGAAILLAFGLGTLPNLMAMGLAARYLDVWRRNIVLRRVAGLALAAYGLAELLRFAWNTLSP